MISLFPGKRYGPIGVDLGTRSVKLVQFSADHERLVDAARWDLPTDPNGGAKPEGQTERIVEALRQAREGRAFRGRDSVICLNHCQLHLQNIRVPKTHPSELDGMVHQEAARRIPFPLEEAEVRYMEAADIRHGEAVMRELILMACHRPVLQETLNLIEQAGLRPISVDVEPAALVRNYVSQFRREQDKQQRCMLLQVGNASTIVVIVQAEKILFVKYIPIGGRQFDEHVAKSLKMNLAEAAALRRHNGDRRSDRQDPAITRSVAEAVRPAIERLATEVSMCLRYHSVTFRGQPVTRVVVGGGEAAPQLLESLEKRLGIKCELSDPFRTLPQRAAGGREGQWDVAAGLALRKKN